MSQQITVYSTPGELTRYLQTGKSAIEAALPKHLNPDRMLRLAVTAFSTTRGLRECTGQSILASLIVASQLGLEPGVAGQGYLIPYRDRRNNVSICTFVAGWQGIVGLLNNTGRATAWTGCVYKGDHFDFQLGSNPKLVHVPGPNYGDPDLIEWVYACGQVNGSQLPVIEAWPIARVWKHRDRFNKVGKDHYSYVHPEMYARKVVLLQVLKYMPRSIELQNAIAAADANERGAFTQVQDGIVIEVPNEEPEPEQAKIGNGNPVDDAAEQQQPKGRQYTVKEEPKPEPKPRQQQKPKPAPEENAPGGEPEHAYTPREEVEEEPSAEEVAAAKPVKQAGPSADDLVKAIKNRLIHENLSTARFVKFMVAEGAIAQVVDITTIPADVLAPVVDDLDGWIQRLKEA